MLRAFFGYRYYIDTSDLGTAITFSNPYFVGRFEYWYTTNKFVDLSGLDDETGGGVGLGLGFGLEFPIKLRESYLGVEFLIHQVNFFDKYTQDYAPKNPDGPGYEDLTGKAWTVLVSYVINW